MFLVGFAIILEIQEQDLLLVQEREREWDKGFNVWKKKESYVIYIDIDIDIDT